MIRRPSPDTAALALAVALTAVLAHAMPAAAQFQPPNLVLPEASPAASVTQTVGVTEMEIRYHRPAVRGRTIWGGLVPFGEVWRAGANENTTISFSTPVTVEGKPLPAGTYGLHVIPTADRWTIAFSTQSAAWGSFSYDPAEDAARVEVKPIAAPFTERLAYTFDDPGDDAVVVSLRWEKLAAPFTVKVDRGATVLADVRRQLRGLQQFGWRAWSDAARLALQHGGDLEEAMRWADRSLAQQRTFHNLTTKAMLLEKRGDAAAAKALRAEAEGLATEADRNAQGYALLGQGKVDEAIAVFARNVELHPQSWNVHDSLGEAYAAKGDAARAVASYERALALVADATQKSRIQAEIARLRAR